MATMKNRRLTQLILTIVLSPLFVIALANVIILTTTRGLVHSDVASITPGRIGLVPGCPPTVTNGTPNTYFEQRMDAAARLVRAGKVDLLLLSGTTDVGYDEPAAMKAALLKRGVTAEHLRLDDQGNRTLESLINVRQRYRGRPIVIITQRSHARRALYLAAHLAIDAVAYNAETDSFNDTIILTLRESLARVRAILDVYWPQLG
jgi:SanA protein